jgi:hypothetical protein
MEYSPPIMDICAAVLIPRTVMLLEVTTVFRGTLVWAVKLKASGIVFGGASGPFLPHAVIKTAAESPKNNNRTIFLNFFMASTSNDLLSGGAGA